MAFVYTRPAGRWSGTIAPSAALIPSTSIEYGEFGTTVAIDGQTAIVGSTRGADSVFAAPAAGWAGTIRPAAQLTTPAGAVDSSGAQISGTTVALSAEVNSTWSDYVYTAPAAGWSGAVKPAAVLKPADGLLSQALALAGTTLYATGRSTVACGCYRGRVFVFREPTHGWRTTQQPSAEVIYDRPSGGALGETWIDELAVDGPVLLVGAYGCAPFSTCTGSVWSFTEPLTGWSGTFTATPAAQTDAGPLGIATSGTDAFVADGANTVTIDRIGAPTQIALPVLTHPLLSGAAHGAPKLAFTLSTPAGAPTVKRVMVSPPAGFRLLTHPEHGLLGLLVNGKPAKASLSGGALVTTLRTPASPVKVVIGPGYLQETNAVRRLAGRRGRAVRTFHIQATDTSEQTDALPAPISL